MSKEDTTLVAIGGGESADSIVDALFASIESVRDARVVVVTVATDHDREMAGPYNSMFRKRNVGHVEMVHVSDRKDAFKESSLTKIERAHLIYFTGGDQLNVTSLLGGSPLHNLLHARVEEGVVIGGTSAGAAMMSSSMIIAGCSDTAPKVGGVEIAPGLDLIGGTIIDTHFSQRGRHGRLLTAIAHYPQIVGIGIDERTAIAVRDKTLKVLGHGSVTIIDGGRMKHTDLVYKEEDEPFGLFDVKLHVLPADYTFDLRTRKPTAPAPGGRTSAKAS